MPLYTHMKNNMYRVDFYAHIENNLETYIPKVNSYL